MHAAHQITKDASRALHARCALPPVGCGAAVGCRVRWGMRSGACSQHAVAFLRRALIVCGRYNQRGGGKGRPRRNEPVVWVHACERACAAWPLRSGACRGSAAPGLYRPRACSAVAFTSARHVTLGGQQDGDGAVGGGRCARIKDTPHVLAPFTKSHLLRPWFAYGARACRDAAGAERGLWVGGGAARAIT